VEEVELEVSSLRSRVVKEVARLQPLFTTARDGGKAFFRFARPRCGSVRIGGCDERDGEE